MSIEYSEVYYPVKELWVHGLFSKDKFFEYVDRLRDFCEDDASAKRDDEQEI